MKPSSTVHFGHAVSNAQHWIHSWNLSVCEHYAGNNNVIVDFRH